VDTTHLLTPNPWLAPISNQQKMSPSQGIAPLPSSPFFPHIRLSGTLQTFRLSTVLVHRILPPTISLLWITCPCPGALLPLPLNLLRMFWRQTASMILLRGSCRAPPNSLGWVSLPRTVLNRRALSPYLPGPTNRSRVLALNHCSKESHSIVSWFFYCLSHVQCPLRHV
jgi:hypothetical protein